MFSATRYTQPYNEWIWRTRYILNQVYWSLLSKIDVRQWYAVIWLPSSAVIPIFDTHRSDYNRMESVVISYSINGNHLHLYKFGFQTSFHKAVVIQKTQNFIYTCNMSKSFTVACFFFFTKIRVRFVENGKYTNAAYKYDLHRSYTLWLNNKFTNTKPSAHCLLRPRLCHSKFAFFTIHVIMWPTLPRFRTDITALCTLGNTGVQCWALAIINP